MVVAMKMHHDKDPADELLEAVGDLSDMTVANNQVLVAIYKRPAKTAGGVFLTDSTRGEDVYQGKVGLVLKKGPLAFLDEASIRFHGQNVERGDWVFFRVSDGWSLTVRRTDCRMLQDVDIKGKIKAPDYLY